jgi:hypothetical protein
LSLANAGTNDLCFGQRQANPESSKKIVSR